MIAGDVMGDWAHGNTGGMSAVNRASGGRPRGRGRPRGPERAKTTVRLLRPLDDRLAEVREASGAGLQDTIDAAVAYWLVTQGWMSEEEVPPTIAATLEQLRDCAPRQDAS